jgi:hypothetical protein
MKIHREVEVLLHELTLTLEEGERWTTNLATLPPEIFLMHIRYDSECSSVSVQWSEHGALAGNQNLEYPSIFKFFVWRRFGQTQSQYLYLISDNMQFSEIITEKCSIYSAALTKLKILFKIT